LRRRLGGADHQDARAAPVRPSETTGRPEGMVEPALSSCEVRRDDDGVAAGEGPDGRADADGAEAGAEEVRPVLGAHEPFVDDRARGAVDAAAPREVLADDSRLDAVPVHAAREG